MKYLVLYQYLSSRSGRGDYEYVETWSDQYQEFETEVDARKFSFTQMSIPDRRHIRVVKDITFDPH